MTTAPPSHVSLLTRTLDECRELYVSSGTLCAHEYPHLISRSGEQFIELMDDLHRALVLKVYFTVCEADQKWSAAERSIAGQLFKHLWDKQLSDDALREAARKAAADTAKLKWYSLIRPFDRIAPLRDRVGTLETIVMRLANLVARADGTLHEKEASAVKSIQAELHHHLRAIPIDEPSEHQVADALSEQAIESLQQEAEAIQAASPSGPSAAAPRGPSLEEALEELDALIGLEQIKQEVRTLANFLKLQQRREAAGLPEMPISLHMVFTGNPGTGKTTIARIVGKIFGAMGILAKGHLVETERSGLVAEYMGQTGPKTHAKINEALDGVLFVDEAYSLLAGDGQDAYGCVAIQTLLKRAEDDRKRLVVILAGYPQEMDALLQSNPGLSSRFHRVLHFDDYAPAELARIFAWLCEKNHYTFPPEVRAKLLVGFGALYERRDRHFGNGRAVRNLFEHAVRRMANRVAAVRELSTEDLTRLDASDIEFSGLPKDFELDSSDAGPWRFRVACDGCGYTTNARGSLLGKRVRCPKCECRFEAAWGEPVCM